MNTEHPKDTITPTYTEKHGRTMLVITRREKKTIKWILIKDDWMVLFTD